MHCQNVPNPGTALGNVCVKACVQGNRMQQFLVCGLALQDGSVQRQSGVLEDNHRL